MKVPTTLVCLLLLAVTLVAAEEKPENVLMKADRDFNSATQQRRAAGWMEFMAPNVVLLTAQPTVGYEAVKADREKVFSNPNLQLTWEPSEGRLFGSGDTGYTSGHYVLNSVNAKGEKVHRTGSYITIWQKQEDGSWKVIADGGAPDPPQEAAKPAEPKKQ